MLKEVSSSDRAPRLHRDAAGIFLVMSGRAIEAGGCLIASDLEPDTIGRAAFGIYKGEEEGSLAEVIEEMTGRPSDVSPELLETMTVPAVAAHAEALGMPADEAAQIAV